MSYATKPVLISVGTTVIFGSGNRVAKAIAICAAAATSVLELFNGIIGTIATIAIGAGGTGYTANDVLTLVQAGGGTQATVRVDTVSSGVITAVTLLTGGSGYVAGSTYATTGGTGTGGTITASTVSDTGTSIGKLSVTANLSDSVELCALSTGGLSARLSGSGAQGYLYHE